MVANTTTRILDGLVRRFLSFLPDKPFLSLRYRILMGTWIDWDNPVTFSEKIQWLKVNAFKPEYTRLVDKLAVKDYVSKIIGSEYVIPTLGVWDNVDEIDWDSLPEQFVIKTTNGGGSCGVVVCQDKSVFDFQSAKEKLRRNLLQTANHYREHPYDGVTRKVFAEKFMEARSADGKIIKDLPDYKFFCFDGEPKFCQVIRDRSSKETIDFYDMYWNHQDFVGLNPVARNGQTPVARNGQTPVARPENLATMQDICRKLSKGISFVRVDLYSIDGDCYFGELTFYPASGIGQFSPDEWNVKLGNLINLVKTDIE